MNNEQTSENVLIHMKEKEFWEFTLAIKGTLMQI